MNRRHFILSLLLSPGGAVGLSALPARASDDFRPLPLSDPNFPWDKSFTIRRSGRYFLSADQIQRPHWTIEGYWPRVTTGLAMLAIESGDVEVDLRGNCLGGDWNTSGVSIKIVKNVWIRNGIVDLARGTGNGRGISAMRTWSPARETGDRFARQWVKLGKDRESLMRVGPERDAPVRPLEPNAFPGYEGRDRDGSVIEIVRVVRSARDYVRNDYRFESLTIKTHLIGVAVEGSHTIIRDCVIESAGLAAIFLAGPYVTIENCKIRLRIQGERSSEVERQSLGAGFTRLPDEIAFPPRAAIVLRDGSNAVIRNNEIRIDYPPFERRPNSHCILVQDGAKNVLIEGNTFVNVEGEPVTLSEGAEVSVRDSRFEKRWLSY